MLKTTVADSCENFKEFSKIFNDNNDIFVAHINKLNKREKLLGLGLMFSLYSLYKLNRKCKAQRIRMEILEHRMDCFVDNQLDAGKETNECNA